MFEKKTVWWIEAITGCTCCADQNFDQGFYFDEETPQKIIDCWRKGDGNPLASQSARYGRYYLCSAEAEILSIASFGRQAVDVKISNVK